MPNTKHEPLFPICQLAMTLEPHPGGKSARTCQCLYCERPDPIRSETLGELLKALQPPR